jgi:hypothetical protein
MIPSCPTISGAISCTPAWLGNHILSDMSSLRYLFDALNSIKHVYVCLVSRALRQERDGHGIQRIFFGQTLT